MEACPRLQTSHDKIVVVIHSPAFMEHLNGFFYIKNDIYFFLVPRLELKGRELVRFPQIK
jgi:hypothetical protein